MKKTLVALAALAVVSAASAQSSVTISGIMDIGVKTTGAPMLAGNSSARKTEFAGNNTATSAVMFTGSEDLGAGMRANFFVELDPNTASSSTGNAPASANWYTGTPFNGQSYVSLSGGFGDLKIGAPNSAAMAASSTAQPFGTAMGSAWSTNFGRLGTVKGLGVNQFLGNANPPADGRVIRHEKTAMYTTPTMGGFSGTLAYAFGNDNSTTASSNSNQFLAGSVGYSNGPLNVMYAYTRIRDGANPVAGYALVPGALTTNALGANGTVAYHVLGANFSFGKATVYAGYTDSNTDNASGALENSRSANIAGKFAVTPQIDLMANYTRRDSGLAANLDARLIGVGADYKLSKRTNLYARYESMDLDLNNGLAQITGGSVTTGVALGVKHTF